MDGAFKGIMDQLDPHSLFISAKDQKNIDEMFRGEFQGIGIEFDILTDTPECPKSSRDSNSSDTVSAEECDGYGANNIMFWTPWSTASRSAGKKQEVLCNHQLHVLKYSPLAK